MSTETLQTKIIESTEALTESLEEYQGCQVVCLDTETQGLNPFEARLLLVQLYASGRTPLVIKFETLDEEGKQKLRSFLDPPNMTREIVIQNAAFDLRFLDRYVGLNISSPTLKIFDTKLAESILGAGFSMNLRQYSSLKNVLKRRFDIALDKDITAQFIGHPGGIFTEEQLDYAVKDVLFMPQLRKVQIEEAQKYGLEATFRLEFELVKHVTQMWMNGITIDVDRWKEIISEEEDLKQLAYQRVYELSSPYLQQQSFFDELPFNVDSSTQVLEFLQGSCGLWIQDTSEQSLRFADDPICNAILDYREHEKLVAAFGKNTLKKINVQTGKLHPEFHQCNTVTGRFSSDNPNVQQIPGRGNGAELRKCFVASPGYKMICADYSQIELRILAELSQEKALVHAYQNHIDIHAQTASIAFGIPLDEVTGDQRKIAKIINFATIYGGGPQAISKGLLQVISEDEARTILQNQFKRHPKVSKHGAYYDLAKEFIASYFQGLPNAKDYLEKSGNNAVYNRYSETPLGRKRFYPELDNESLPKEQRLEEAEGVKRKGKNHAIQGCSADITKVAIIRIGQYFEQHPEFGGRILLTVHDEIATEVYQDVADDFLAIQKRLMIEAGETFLKTVPVEVDAKISDYWEK